MSKQDIIEHVGAFKTLLINMAILGGITLVNIELILKIIALLVTIAYTVWKFYSDWHKNKTNGQNGN